jgi:hypothetical protein
MQDRMWKHTLSSVLPRSYKCSTYTASANRWLCEVEVGRLLEISTLVKKAPNRDCNLAITTPRLRWLSTRTHMSWPRQEGLSLHVQLRTQARTGKNATKLVDECIAHECWVLQTVEW